MVEKDTYTDKLKAEFEKVKKATGKDELYYPFLRLVQVSCVLGLVLTLTGTTPVLLANMGLSGIFVGITVLINAVVINGLFFFLAEYALRKIRKKEFIGIAIGLVLALLHIPGIFLLVGAFGFYALLNPEFQKAYYRNCPKEFLNLLGKVDLNFSEKLDDSPKG